MQSLKTSRCTLQSRVRCKCGIRLVVSTRLCIVEESYINVGMGNSRNSQPLMLTTRMGTKLTCIMRMGSYTNSTCCLSVLINHNNGDNQARVSEFHPVFFNSSPCIPSLHSPPCFCSLLQLESGDDCLMPARYTPPTLTRRNCFVASASAV